MVGASIGFGAVPVAAPESVDSDGVVPSAFCRVPKSELAPVPVRLNGERSFSSSAEEAAGKAKGDAFGSVLPGTVPGTVPGVVSVFGGGVPVCGKAGRTGSSAAGAGAVPPAAGAAAPVPCAYDKRAHAVPASTRLTTGRHAGVVR